MQYQETTDYSFLLNENYYAYDYKEDTDALHIFVKSRQHKCRCPKCGMESRKIHATYVRTLQDTPIRNKQIFIQNGKVLQQEPEKIPQVKKQALIREIQGYWKGPGKKHHVE